MNTITSSSTTGSADSLLQPSTGVAQRSIMQTDFLTLLTAQLGDGVIVGERVSHRRVCEGFPVEFGSVRHWPGAEQCFHGIREFGVV